jgi:hypothetical protein
LECFRAFFFTQSRHVNNTPSKVKQKLGVHIFLASEFSAPKIYMPMHPLENKPSFYAQKIAFKVTISSLLFASVGMLFSSFHILPN